MFTSIGISLIVNVQACMAPKTYRAVITDSSEEALVRSSVLFRKMSSTRTRVDIELFYKKKLKNVSCEYNREWLKLNFASCVVHETRS